MLSLKDIHVSVADTPIIKWVSLDFELGKNYCLLGQNGSWKSSLAAAIMGHPGYEVTSWDVSLDGVSIVDEAPENRSKKGLFLSFQNIVEIPWIRLGEYLRTIYNLHEERRNADFTALTPFVFNRFIKPICEEFHIDFSFLDRDLNVWFSWGEKRKIEMLQLKLINPKYIILDEVDSWLDVDAFRSIADMLKSLSSDENTIIIITHYFTILDYVKVDWVHILEEGKVHISGDMSLARTIQEKWFKS